MAFYWQTLIASLLWVCVVNSSPLGGTHALRPNPFLQSMKSGGSLAQNARFGAPKSQNVRSFSCFAWQAQYFGSVSMQARRFLQPSTISNCEKKLQKKWTQTHRGFILAGPFYLNVWTFGFVSILFPNLVPHASKYFQSCLPLLHPMNIIFQGQYECLGQYGDAPHTWVSASYLLWLFRVVPVSLQFRPPFLDVGGNSLLDAQTRKFAGNPWFNKMLNSLSWSLYGKLNGRYADVQCCLGTTRWSFSWEVPPFTMYHLKMMHTPRSHWSSWLKLETSIVLRHTSSRNLSKWNSTNGTG